MLIQKDFHPDFLGEMCRRLNLTPYPRTRQFVVQHLFPDTVRLLKLLHQYIPVESVVGISYSGNAESVEELRSLGIRVLTPEYSQLATTIAEELAVAIECCQERGDRLIIHEVGGFAIRALHEPYYIGKDTVIGALEITKQGVWVAEHLEDLRIPQLNVAQTRLKQIEGRLVGEAVVAALDTILRELGYATVGREGLVCGYGWVGRWVAQSLKQRGMSLSIRDIDSVALVAAAMDGFVPNRSDRLKRSPAIVVGASGSCSIDANIIDQLPNRCFLVSGASKNHEIDLSYLESRSVKNDSIHQHVRRFTMDDGRHLLLVNDGYPVNFTGASVPDEIVELLLAELIMLIPKLIDDTPPPGIYTLPPAAESLPADIWLSLR